MNNKFSLEMKKKLLNIFSSCFIVWDEVLWRIIAWQGGGAIAYLLYSYVRRKAGNV